MRPPLPTIHPLRSPDDTQDRGPLDECLCDRCGHWSPLVAHIYAQLDERGKALLDELNNHYGNIEMDLDVANAKLDGSWPGWEALKGFTPNQETA